jgi:hypothetical protein
MITINSVAPSLVNSFLRRAIVNGSLTTVTSVLDIILDFFRHPSLSEDMVLVLLHMLRSYILLVSVFEEGSQKNVTLSSRILFLLSSHNS